MIPNSISLLDKLEQINFESNSISELPEDLSKLSHLKFISFENCELEALPIWFQNFKKYLYRGSKITLTNFFYTFPRYIFIIYTFKKFRFYITIT
jgi:hypothetical protein